MTRITALARQFGLSRSTLLYYDRIGLLSPSARSAAGYRLYSAADRERLETICSFRHAGLGIEDIRKALDSAQNDTAALLRKSFLSIGGEIRALQAKQRLLAGMLSLPSGGALPERVDKQTWVEMFRAAGVDERGMNQWHTDFERRAPEAHHAFLLSLGIDEEEAREIREKSGAGCPKVSPLCGRTS